MARPLHISAGIGAVSTTLLLATLAGPGVAAGASHVKAKTPTLKVTVTKTTLKVSGPHKLQAGRVDLAITAKGGERSIEVVSFKPGYSFAKLDSDLTAFGASEGANGASKAGIAALDKAVKNTKLYGGLDAVKGQKESASVVLPKAGTYYLYNDSGDVPANPVKLTVTGPIAHRTAPKSSATVIATSAKKFSGAKVLPAKGTVTFKNTSTNSPHLLGLLHVAAGTTAKQVIEGFMSNSQPKFFRKGQAGTDAVGEGNSQTLTYNLPAGTYAEACFFPDLQTGVPHAFMGMVRIVTLK
jgi:hypothetical protein